MGCISRQLQQSGTEQLWQGCRDQGECKRHCVTETHRAQEDDVSIEEERQRVNICSKRWAGPARKMVTLFKNIGQPKKGGK